MKWIVKLERNGKSFRVVIPIEVVKSRGLSVEGYVVINDNEDKAITLERLSDTVWETFKKGKVT